MDDKRFEEVLCQLDDGYPQLDGDEVAAAWQGLLTEANGLAAKLGRMDELLEVLCK